MHRFWSQANNELVENPRVEEFIREIQDVCRRWNLSISHEDTHGAFIIEPYCESNLEWLSNAFLAKSLG